MSVISDLVRQLRMAAASAKRTRDRTGRYDTTTVYFAFPVHIALIIANRLEMTEDDVIRKARARSDMREIAAVAEDALKDSYLRFQYAVTDLEIFLQESIGRHPMTMQEIREHRQITEARPSQGPQPFVRKKPGTQASSELLRTIRTNRLGNPREPGEDG